ncbi:unnamed protein product [marine sediment metagenome]|uniref:Uncharacterized protein n=1 Tax=marine sediment metagenome TaxID=412755 RepID=X1FCU9_9ZZZZ
MASLVSAAVGALLEFDEVEVRMLDENTVEYKILTTGMVPEAIELKTLIWSYLSPPVKSLEITDVKIVERGFVTNRYLVTVRGDVKGLPMARGKGPIRRWRRRLGRLIPEEPEG